jgi:hypothetical protein
MLLSITPSDSDLDNYIETIIDYEYKNYELGFSGISSDAEIGYLPSCFTSHLCRNISIIFDGWFLARIVLEVNRLL